MGIILDIISQVANSDGGWRVDGDRYAWTVPKNMPE